MDAATQMAADGLQAFGMIGTVLWTMLRIGAVAMAMPMVGTRAVPSRVRVVLAGTLAIALAPLLPPVPDWTGFWPSAYPSASCCGWCSKPARWPAN